MIEKHGRKPNDEQYRRIGKMHNSKVGHFGLERTLKRSKDLQDTWEFQPQNMLDLNRGIFLKHPERLIYKSLSV